MVGSDIQNSDYKGREIPAEYKVQDPAMRQWPKRDGDNITGG